MSATGDVQAMTGDGQTAERGTVGCVRLSITGGFGGGTAKLQAKNPLGAWVDVAGGSFTVATDTLFEFPPNVQNQLRVDVNGSTTPTISVWIQSELDR